MKKDIFNDKINYVRDVAVLRVDSLKSELNTLIRKFKKELYKKQVQNELTK